MTCKCPIRPGMSYDELMDQILRAGKMCTEGDGLNKVGFMCPTLTKALDKADLTRDRHARQAQKLKQAGYTADQIAEMPTRTRRRSGNVQNTIPDLNFDV